MNAAQRLTLLLAAAICFAAAPAAHAAVIFDQTPAVILPSFSDLDNEADGRQAADNFVLQSDATASSVLWRGSYSVGNSPTAPLDFTLFIYGDSGGLPDQSNILSQTTVSLTLAQITDTGVDASFSDVYEFAADINPVALSGATNYWFSVLADTSDDANDAFYWGAGIGGGYAVQTDVTGMGGFTGEPIFDLYFQINGTAMAVVPVPAAAWLALPLLGVMGVSRWRKSRIA